MNKKNYFFAKNLVPLLQSQLMPQKNKIYDIIIDFKKLFLFCMLEKSHLPICIFFYVLTLYLVVTSSVKENFVLRFKK